MPATFRSKPSPFKFGGRKRFSKRRGSGRPPKEDDGSASSPIPSAPPSPSALESPIASLPPAERHPEPSASASSLPVTEISSEDDLTAIERKIAMMQRKAPAKYSEPNEPDDPEKQLGLTEGEELDGYRLLGVSCIEALVSALLCPECAGSSLKLSETGKGVLLAFVVSCPTCGEVARAPHSVNIGDTRQNDLAARIGLSSRDCGVSFTKLTHLFTGMNMPPPICLKTSQKVAAKVHDAATAAAGNVMRTAAQSVRKRENAKEGELLDVCVTYDGTWHKRGHTSHFGVGVAIELESGLVLDYSVHSNYCQLCTQGPKPGTEGYTEWMEDHRPNCQKNFNGSAGAMEVEAATVIFGRSVEKHGMQYTTMLCDGDSKAFSKVAGLELYNKEINKEDCVNHVAKRMYAGLEALKKAKKGLGGKGKLTNLKMKQLTNYYACSLKDNAPDVTAMQRGVFASLLHSYSTDEEPRHVGCPTGTDSWCHYNRSKALEAAGEPPAFRPHKPAFSKEIAREMVPLYNRLSQRDLLERCSRMKTQNNNESFNALVWKRCPKVEFASLKTVECAVALAVLEFNLGPRGIEEALLEMGIQPGSYQASYGERATKIKVAKAQVKALESSKMSHKKRKMEAVAKAQRDRAEEGVTYAPGAF